MPTRKYEQGLRAEAAEETRQRILDALYARLREQPSEPVSVEQVARLARVARSTIYLVFGSRAGLFDALAAELFRTRRVRARGGGRRDPDAREHLRGGIRGGTRDVRGPPRRLPRAVLDGAARRGRRRRRGAPPGGGAGARDGAAGRAARRRRASCATDVTVADAAHLIWLLASFDAFDVLYTGRGLSVDEIVDSSPRRSSARSTPEANACPHRAVTTRAREAAALPALGQDGGRKGRLSGSRTV